MKRKSGSHAERNRLCRKQEKKTPRGIFGGSAKKTETRRAKEAETFLRIVREKKGAGAREESFSLSQSEQYD